MINSNGYYSFKAECVCCGTTSKRSYMVDGSIYAYCEKCVKINKCTLYCEKFNIRMSPMQDDILIKYVYLCDQDFDVLIDYLAKQPGVFIYDIKSNNDLLFSCRIYGVHFDLYYNRSVVVHGPKTKQITAFLSELEKEHRKCLDKSIE